MTETPKKPRTPEMRLATAIRKLRVLSPDHREAARQLADINGSARASIEAAAAALHACETDDAATALAVVDLDVQKTP